MVTRAEQKEELVTVAAEFATKLGMSESSKASFIKSYADVSLGTSGGDAITDLQKDFMSQQTIELKAAMGRAAQAKEEFERYEALKGTANPEIAAKWQDKAKEMAQFDKPRFNAADFRDAAAKIDHRVVAVEAKLMNMRGGANEFGQNPVKGIDPKRVTELEKADIKAFEAANPQANDFNVNTGVRGVNASGQAKTDPEFLTVKRQTQQEQGFFDAYNPLSDHAVITGTKDSRVDVESEKASRRVRESIDAYADALGMPDARRANLIRQAEANQELMPAAVQDTAARRISFDGKDKDLDALNAKIDLASWLGAIPGAVPGTMAGNPLMAGVGAALGGKATADYIREGSDLIIPQRIEAAKALKQSVENLASSVGMDPKEAWENVSSKKGTIEQKTRDMEAGADIAAITAATKKWEDLSANADYPGVMNALKKPTPTEVAPEPVIEPKPTRASAMPPSDPSTNPTVSTPTPGTAPATPGAAPAAPASLPAGNLEALKAAIDDYATQVGATTEKRTEWKADAATVAPAQLADVTQNWKKLTEAAREYFENFSAAQTAQRKDTAVEWDKQRDIAGSDVQKLTNRQMNSEMIREVVNTKFAVSFDTDGLVREGAVRNMSSELVDKKAGAVPIPLQEGSSIAGTGVDTTLILTNKKIQEVASITKRDNVTTVMYKDGTGTDIASGNLKIVQDMGDGKTTRALEAFQADGMNTLEQVKLTAARIEQAMSREARDAGKILAFTYDAKGTRTGTAFVSKDGRNASKTLREDNNGVPLAAGTLLTFRDNDDMAKVIHKQVGTDGLAVVDRPPAATTLASARTAASTSALEGAVGDFNHPITGVVGDQNTGRTNNGISASEVTLNDGRNTKAYRIAEGAVLELGKPAEMVLNGSTRVQVQIALAQDGHTKVAVPTASAGAISGGQVSIG